MTLCAFQTFQARKPVSDFGQFSIAITRDIPLNSFDRALRRHLVRNQNFLTAARNRRPAVNSLHLDHLAP